MIFIEQGSNLALRTTSLGIKLHFMAVLIGVGIIIWNNIIIYIYKKYRHFRDQMKQKNVRKE